ncbi:MAG: hypothetical protein P8Y47_02095 [Alphaproteobacteria bacterium]
MTSALFVSHKGQLCDVHQHGVSVFNSLRQQNGIEWRYLECENADELTSALEATKPHILVLNYHPATMPWAAKTDWQAPERIVFSLYNEFQQATWKQMLTDNSTAAISQPDIVSDLLDDIAGKLKGALSTENAPSGVASAPLQPLQQTPQASKQTADALHHLIYDLRFIGGPRELQIGLKIARLFRKISWKIRPKRRHKHIERKNAAALQTPVYNYNQPSAPNTPVTPELIEQLDATLVTLALDHRNRNFNRDRETPPAATAAPAETKLRA